MTEPTDAQRPDSEAGTFNGSEQAERERSLGRLGGEDENVLRVWHDSQALLDERYANKALLSIADLAMRDPEFRARLVGDAASVLRELPADLELPDGEIVFHHNTENTLHVVLPPRVGDLSFRPAELREALSSRTDEIMVRAGEVGLGGGNWYNHGDVFADAIFGPPRDHGDH